MKEEAGLISSWLLGQYQIILLRDRGKHY